MVGSSSLTRLHGGGSSGGGDEGDGIGERGGVMETEGSSSLAIRPTSLASTCKFAYCSSGFDV